MNYVSICSGIGGFDLAMQEIGGRAVFYCEQNSYRQAVLQARMRDGRLDCAPIRPDLRTLNGLEWRGTVDCLVAGFPCPPFSTAGKRLGAADPRNLWSEVRRVIGEVAPSVVFLENVSGLAYPNGRLPSYATVVVGQLAEMGYDASWGIVSARDAGASHRRDRWWCLGYSQRDGTSRNPNLVGAASGRDVAHIDSATRGPELTSEAGDDGKERLRRRDGQESTGGLEGIRLELGDPEGQRLQEHGLHQLRDGLIEAGHALGNPNGTGYQGKGSPTPARVPQPFPPGPEDSDAWAGVLRERPDLAPAIGGRLNPDFVEWMMGFPNRWSDIPGASHRLRLEALGDAVVPAQAVLAWRSLQEAPNAQV